MVGADGATYWIANNIDTGLVPTTVLQDIGLGDVLAGTPLGGARLRRHRRRTTALKREYLVVWAGDNNVLDRTGKQLTDLPDVIGPDLIGQKDLIGPDFLAVVDATKGSPSYGKVVNTATVGPLVENEPHHMQYIWHKGNNIFAGGLFTDVTYVIDTSQAAGAEAQARQPAHGHALRLGARRLLGDQGRQGLRHLHGRAGRARAVHLLRRHHADRQRLRRLARRGRAPRRERQDPLRGSGRRRRTAETTQRCDNIPLLPLPTCANPHGIQAREDLKIAGDQ